MPRPLTPSPTSSRWISRSPAYRLRNFTILEKFIFHFPTHLYVDSNSPSATHRYTSSFHGELCRNRQHPRRVILAYWNILEGWFLVTFRLCKNLSTTTHADTRQSQFTIIVDIWNEFFLGTRKSLCRRSIHNTRFQYSRFADPSHPMPCHPRQSPHRLEIR